MIDYEVYEEEYELLQQYLNHEGEFADLPVDDE